MHTASTLHMLESVFVSSITDQSFPRQLKNLPLGQHGRNEGAFLQKLWGLTGLICGSINLDLSEWPQGSAEPDGPQQAAHAPQGGGAGGPVMGMNPLVGHKVDRYWADVSPSVAKSQI